MRGWLPLLILNAVASPIFAATPQADLYWQQGDYRRAFAEAFQPASRGDAHAQFLLGEAYRLGRSVDPNYPLAMDWYGRAARQGDAAAASQLGLLLVGQRLTATAVTWLTRAARLDEPHALWALATLYYDGDGVEPDAALALALIRRAADHGMPEARARLADIQQSMAPAMQAEGEIRAREMLAAHDTPSEADPAAPALKPMRIQVGAFRSPAAAERGWLILGGRMNGTASIDHEIVRAGRVYRLQVNISDPARAGLFQHQLAAARWQHFLR